MNAHLVTSIVVQATPPAQVVDCARALKRLRWERERAAIQREIDRLQERGEGGIQINTLLARKGELAQRIEELT